MQLQSSETKLDNGTPLVVLTATVFLTPLLMQITGNNLVKLMEDLVYALVLLYSIFTIVRRNIVLRISIWAAVFLFFITIFSLIGAYYNGISLVILQYREFKYLLLLIILIPYYEDTYLESIWKLFRLIATFSIPVSIIQWYIYKDIGFFDGVTGLFGFKQSATLTSFVLILFFSELGMRLYKGQKVMGVYFLFLVPTVINETKITLVLFPIMLFSTLVLTKKATPKVIIPVFLVLLLFFTGWAYLYKNALGTHFANVFTMKFLEDYMLATDWTNDVGRFAKLAYGFDIIANNNFFTGYGLGASYNGASSGLSGYIWEKYYDDNPLMFIGTRIQLFDNILELGIIGTLIIFIFFIYLLRRITKVKTLSFIQLMALNSFIIVFVSLAYIQIFHIYQIMYTFVLYTFVFLKKSYIGNSEKKEELLT